MIQIKITNEQLLALKADSNFAALVDGLLSIHTLRTARSVFRPRPDGWLDVDEKYLAFTTLVALGASHGIPVGDMTVYVEVSTAKLSRDIPAYLPNSTKTVITDSIPIVSNKTWEDLKSRTSLDGTKHICSFRVLLNFDTVKKLMNEAGVLILNHPDTLLLISDKYQKVGV